MVDQANDVRPALQRPLERTRPDHFVERAGDEVQPRAERRGIAGDAPRASGGAGTATLERGDDDSTFHTSAPPCCRYRIGRSGCERRGSARSAGVAAGLIRAKERVGPAHASAACSPPKAL